MVLGINISYKYWFWNFTFIYNKHYIEIIKSQLIFINLSIKDLTYVRIMRGPYKNHRIFLDQSFSMVKWHILDEISYNLLFFPIEVHKRMLDSWWDSLEIYRESSNSLISFLSFYVCTIMAIWDSNSICI